MQLTEYQKSIIAAAVGKYGEAAQLDMVIEECSELIQAVCKLKRVMLNPSATTVDRVKARQQVIEEAADTSIMLKELEIIVSSDFQTETDLKVLRLKQRLNGGTDNE